jgi:hypothetical protein
MHIEEFSQQYRVRTRRDECGNTVIPGKLWKAQPKPTRSYGHQVFEFDDGRFGVLLMFHVDNGHEIGGSGKSARCANARKTLLLAGFTLHQDGDAEGVALFNPENKAQSRLALKLAGVRKRRVVHLTDKQRKAIADRLATGRVIAQVSLTVQR